MDPNAANTVTRHLLRVLVKSCHLCEAEGELPDEFDNEMQSHSVDNNGKNDGGHDTSDAGDEVVEVTDSSQVSAPHEQDSKHPCPSQSGPNSDQDKQPIRHRQASSPASITLSAVETTDLLPTPSTVKKSSQSAEDIAEFFERMNMKGDPSSKRVCKCCR
jgi:hypothetical protein